jgi:gamma-glutamylputrescine oxidase
MVNDDSAAAASYYENSATRPPMAAPLQGSIRADICVVGAGIAGLSSALHLAARGYRVVILEQQCVGWGASGRNGGQVLAGVAASQAKLQALVGAADAARIWQISVEGVALTRELIRRHQIECDWVSGHISVAIKPRQVRELKGTQAEMASLGGAPARWLEAEELRSVLASERYRAGLFDAYTGHMHPLRYTLGLAQAARQASVTLYEQSRALDFDAGPEGVRVRTSAGEVRCAQLLLAGNAWLGRTAPVLARKIIGIGTHIVATEVLGEERATALIRNNAAVYDLNWVVDYFRRSADHRLLFGGRVSYSRLTLADLTRATQERMLGVFPQLKDARIEYSWGGLVDITMNRAPHFGRLAPNVWFLQGFSGHGLALATIAGQCLAEAVAASSERFDVFARIPHRDFPGGPALRRPALVLAMLWYRLRDLM